jgi:hypothetical protein
VADVSVRFALCGILTAASTAAAQEVRGVVLDSASRQPIGGAVVVLLDANLRDVGRLVASSAGTFTLRSSIPATRLRVLRLGFRPREVALPTSSNAPRFEILMTALPTLLEPQRVVEQSKCPRRADYAASFALWEQAKAGLLAAVTAREALPATMTNLTYKRRVEGSSQRVLAQNVRIHQGNAQRSFQAVHTAAEFARLGFVRTTEQGDLYLSPDAEVLLDDEFMRSYCLSLTSPDAAHPRELGLSFAPATRARHVDISGTVWIDTAARALRRIEFKYVGLESETDRFHPGGQLLFAEVRDGVPQIQRWNLRTVEEKGPFVDAVVRANPGGPVDARRYSVHESGGELARASWSDGVAWHAPLGALRLHVTTENGTPAGGFTLSLDDTDYRAMADSSGALEISDLLPGPYQASVSDPALAAIELPIPTSFRFVASRDSVIETSLVVPTAAELVEKACKKEGLWTPGSYLLVARVVTPDGKPVQGARWSVSVGRSKGVTGSNGIFQYCFGLDVGKLVQIQVSRDGEVPTTVTRTLSEKLTALRLEIPARPE